MKTLFALAMIVAALIASQPEEPLTESAEFVPVPELAYRVAPDFFQLPAGMNFGETLPKPRS